MMKRTIFSRPIIIILHTHYFCPLSFSSTPSKVLYNLPAFIAMLKSCALTKSLFKGKQLHSHLLINGFLNSSPLLTTSLINMYSKCNSISDALLVFNMMMHNPNVFAYNAVIAGFITNEFPKPAFEFYWKMRLEGVIPDKYTYPCVIKSCSEVLEARTVHGLLFKFGLELDVFIGSALVHCYLKFGLIEDAQIVFEEFPLRDDVVLWNAMINGCMQAGEFDMALEVFSRMSEEGVVLSKFTVTGILSGFSATGNFSNGRAIHGLVVKMGYDSGVAVSNALIDMYGKCKRILDALEIFEMMAEKDIFSWNSILCVHGQCGDHDGTLRFFKRMLLAGVQPDLVSVTTILPACAHLAALMHGKEIHGYMITNGLGKDDYGDTNDIHLNNAVMDLYSKCGSMREAHLVFNKMSYVDLASWNIMIMGYGIHGFGNEALDRFYCMCELGLKPDEITFVGVLSACSHAGLVSQGREFFAQMQRKYSVVPTIEHYTCMIDMLGRDGQLQEAYELLSTMPIEANPVLWRALLAACRLHGNAALAEVAAQQVFELEPEHCGSYVLISNVYGAVGRYDEVSEVRHSMRQQNVRKTPGCSWIELNNGVQVFVTGGRGHPEACFIYAGLNSLTACLCEHGYTPDNLRGTT